MCAPGQANESGTYPPGASCRWDFAPPPLPGRTHTGAGAPLPADVCGVALTFARAELEVKFDALSVLDSETEEVPLSVILARS